MARTRRLLRLVLTGTLGWVALVQGQDNVTITWGPEHTLRELAEVYLQDPDAWPEILRANRLDSAHQLRAGMRLEIPISEILALDQSLKELRALVYRATKAGAEVFAKELISEANARHADALEARRQGAFDRAGDSAKGGIIAAKQALEISLRNRDVPAEGILDSAGGTVQRRRPSEFDWTSIAVKSLLAEQERLRTLSRSFAVVRFRDASSLRIDENAQLAIRRIRRDRLTRSEQVDIVLYGGGIRALIDPQVGRQTLHVNTPGIETRVRSRHYWMQKTPEDTRLANYEGEIEVSAQGGTVLVRKNQGTLVKSDAPPQAPVTLLTPPGLLRPRDDEVLYDAGVDFAWEANGKASLYWLEVARDAEFSRLLFSETAVTNAGYYLPVAEEGIYFWRVSAVDSSGLPGPASNSLRFRMRWDRTPPYLVLHTPSKEQEVRGASIEVAGRTEPGATITLNGDPVAVGDDGRFATKLGLVDGANQLVLEAKDSAGNTSRTERALNVIDTPDFTLRFGDGLTRDDQARLVVNRSQFSLQGTTLAGTSIRIRTPDSSSFEASTVADENGSFRFNLTARTDVTDFVILAEGPAGQLAQQRFTVVLDAAAPTIHLDSQPPNRTASAILTLKGLVDGGTTISHGDQPVPLSDEGRFSLDVTLQEGTNVIRLTAHDLAGNQSQWQQTILLDREPPRLIDYRLMRGEKTAVRTLLVEINARDKSGMTAGIPYSLQVGEYVHRGVASRDADRSCHRDRILLPPSAIGKAQLLSVDIQDYLGNRQEIQLD